MLDRPLPGPDELLLAQVVVLAGCSAKTVRRAVSAGELPHRYALAERGRYLVFRRADVEGWIASRMAAVRGGREPGDAEIGALSAAIDDLALAAGTIQRRASALQRQVAALDACHERLRVLSEQLRRALR